MCQLFDDLLELNDTELVARAVAEAKDFPELEAARAHLARLRLRVRHLLLIPFYHM